MASDLVSSAKARAGLLCAIILLSVFTVLPPTNVAQDEYNPVWDSGDMEAILQYMEDNYDPISDQFYFPPQYPIDPEKADEVIQSALEAELVRDEHKDDSLLSESFLVIWDAINSTMEYYSDEAWVEQMFSVLEETQLIGPAELAKLQGTFVDWARTAKDMLSVKLDWFYFEYHYKHVYTEIEAIYEAQELVSGTFYQETFTLDFYNAEIYGSFESGTGLLDVIFGIWDVADSHIRHENTKRALEDELSDDNGNGVAILPVVAEYEKIIEDLHYFVDIAKIIASTVASTIGAEIGWTIGAALGASIGGGFAVVGAIPGFIIGGAIGMFAGATVFSEVAETLVDVVFSYIFDKPVSERIEDFGLELNLIDAEIVAITSKGNDDMIIGKEWVSVTIENIGVKTQEFRVTPFPSVWDVNDAWDWWNILDIEAIDFNNYKTIELSPGENGTVQFAVTPNEVTLLELGFGLGYDDNWIWPGGWHGLDYEVHEFWAPLAIQGLMMTANLESNATLALYDPLGRYIEMGGGNLGWARSWTDPQGDQHIVVYQVLGGKYNLEILGVSDGGYDISINFTKSGSPLPQRYDHSDSILPGEVHNIFIIVSVVNDNLDIEFTDPEESRQNEQLVASVCGPSVIYLLEGESHTFVSCSDDPDGDIVSQEWTFDGMSFMGDTLTVTWYDNTEVQVCLTVTSVTEFTVTDKQGNEHTYTLIETETHCITVIVQNVRPTARIDAAYMFVDFTLRFAGEKWHNAYWDLYETDFVGEGVGPSKLLRHLEVERHPGSPDEQSQTVYDVYLDMEKVYYFKAWYSPYEDDNPINGQLWGSNPVWIDLTFEDGSEERIKHNFNVQQTIVRNSTHWVHVAPWLVDLSPWLVGHVVTFSASTYDVGTDDETFIWEWGDTTSPEHYTFPYRSWGALDPLPSPYDKDKGTYPVDLHPLFYHTYVYEDDFIVHVTVVDDDGGSREARPLDIDAIHTDHICATK